MPMPATTFSVGGPVARSISTQKSNGNSRRRTVSTQASSDRNNAFLAPARTARMSMDSSRSPYAASARRNADENIMPPPPPYQPRDSIDTSCAPSVRSLASTSEPQPRRRRTSILSLSRFRSRQTSNNGVRPPVNEVTGSSPAQVEVQEYRERERVVQTRRNVAGGVAASVAPEVLPTSSAVTGGALASETSDDNYRRGYEAGVRDALAKIHGLLSEGGTAALQAALVTPAPGVTSRSSA